MVEHKRIAWMAVGCRMFKEMCGDRVLSFLKMKDLMDFFDFKFSEGVLDTFSDWTEETYKNIHEGLLLPANSKVVGVSLGFRFQYCQVALQIECDDFREMVKGCAMPQVEAVYYLTEDLLGKTTTPFDYWCGYAALVDSYEMSARVPLDRCSKELGHFAAPGSGLCYCEWVARDPETLKWAVRPLGFTSPGMTWWDSAYSSTSNNPTAEDAHHIINAVADQLPEYAMTPAELRVPRKNASELSDRCEAIHNHISRCTLKIGHEGKHINLLDFEWDDDKEITSKDIQSIVDAIAAKAPKVKSSNRGYEFL